MLIHLPCLCGSTDNFKVIFEQNFTEGMISPGNFTARGKHDYEKLHAHYRIVRCRACGQLYSTPVLDFETIGRLYRESPQDYLGETCNIVSVYSKPLLKWDGLLRSRNAAIEVGCGSGFFVAALKEMGYRDIVGFEPSVQAVEEAREDIRPYLRNCLFEDAQIDEGSLDLVCAFQVLDHFMDPAMVMNRFYELLRPGGVCYVVIHDETALHVKILGDKSPIIDVSHIYYFNKKTLSRLFQRVGFDVVDTFNIWNAYALKTWLRMLPIPFKSSLLRLLHTVRLDNMVLGIPAGNIGIIGRKKD